MMKILQKNHACNSLLRDKFMEIFQILIVLGVLILRFCTKIWHREAVFPVPNFNFIGGK